MTVEIRQGDCLEMLRAMPAESVNCCITSPPYWGLRRYGGWEMQVLWSGSWSDFNLPKKGNKRKHWKFRIKVRADNRGIVWAPNKKTHICAYGLEPTPELYVDHSVIVFSEVRRVLRDDGTLWLNLGDCYITQPHGNGSTFDPKYPTGRNRIGDNSCNRASFRRDRATVLPPKIAKGAGLKPKDLAGIPWTTALALRADGWWLRKDIIWDKPNCMPESCKDRPTNSHEYLFFLSKSAKYYYDQDAVKVPASPDSHPRYARGRSNSHKYTDGGPGRQTIAKTFEHMLEKPGVNPKAKMAVPTGWDTGPGSHRARRGRYKQNQSFSNAVKDVVEERNLRSVWRIPCKGFSGAHFATFPAKLVEPCILAGCPRGGIVLDPFGGSGTTGMVAEQNGRNSILIELKPENCEMAKFRTSQTGIFCDMQRVEVAG